MPRSAGESDDDASMSGSEGSVDDEVLEQVFKFEEVLVKRPHDDATRCKLIALLDKYPKLETQVYQARDQYAKVGLMPPEMWQEWIEGYRRTAENLVELYERAVQHFEVPSLWAAYLKAFAKQPSVASFDAEGLKEFRALAERAVAVAGQDLSHGGAVWDAWLETEYAAAHAGAASSDDVDEVARRRLALPLADGPAALERYKQWLGGREVPQKTLRAHASATSLLARRMPFESQLAAPDGKGIAREPLKKYIQIEKAAKNDAHVACLYERGVAAAPDDDELWREYGAFVAARSGARGGPKSAVDVYTRALKRQAVRSRSGVLWLELLRAIDHAQELAMEGEDLDGAADLAAKQSGVFVEAVEVLSADGGKAEDVVEVALACSDMLGRMARGGGEWGPDSGALVVEESAEWHRASLAHAMKVLQERCGAEIFDPRLELHAVCAEAQGSKEEGAQVWEGAVKGPHGKLANTWIAYAEFLRRAGDVAGARGVFKRCYQRHLKPDDGRVCRAWERMEGRYGTAASVADCRAKIAAAGKPGDAAHGGEAANGRKDAADAGKKGKGESSKRKRDDSSAAVAAPKRARGDAGAGEGAVTTPAQGEGGGPVRQWHDDSNTVFVKGIKAEVTSDTLRGLFEPVGGLKEVRMVMDKHHPDRHRGCAYVEFEAKDNVERAVELNGTELAGATLFVAVSNPRSGGGGGRGGRGRGGRFDGGRGGRYEGGRGRYGRGRFDGGGGGGRGRRGGVGFSGGVDNAHSHQRNRLDVDGGGPAPPLSASASLVPRSLLARSAAGDEPQKKPMSNNDFRSLLGGGGAAKKQDE
ncbi:unnamed protein product [Pedinophyceae sp. YPF-701]|nr:unnamed protein product [Pedinophyceae sp. YPF-701]